MFEVIADRRRIEAEPDEGAHARVVAIAPRLVAVRVEAARALKRIEETRTFVAHQCASIEEYGVRYLGVPAREARELVDLGRALDVAPTPAVAAAVESARAADAAVAGGADGLSDGDAAESDVANCAVAATAEVPALPPQVTVAEAVLSGALSVERAVAAGRFVAKPGLVREGEDPVALAMSGSMRQVRETLRSREEELAQRETVVTLALSVVVRARDGFRRARILASERAGEMLTEGQTFSLVVENFLDDFDPLRRGAGTRRLPDTADLPGQRYVPAAARRAVQGRSGGQCEVPGCTRRAFLELAHDDAHRSGGSREEDNLWHACGRHHVQFDAGLIRISGWRDGRPRFCDAHGRPLEDRARIARRSDPDARAGEAGVADEVARSTADRHVESGQRGRLRGDVRFVASPHAVAPASEGAGEVRSDTDGCDERPASRSGASRESAGRPVALRADGWKRPPATSGGVSDEVPALQSARNDRREHFVRERAPAYGAWTPTGPPP